RYRVCISTVALSIARSMLRHNLASMSHSPELILCSATLSLPAEWLPRSGSVSIAEDQFFNELAQLPPLWLPRAQAETDPAYKQWIPYVLLRNRSGALAAYPRQGSEARLHGRWSLGIGGHINPADGAPAANDANRGWRQWLWNGLHREITEEFSGAAAGRTRFLGLVHESLSDVGRVHLGAVFLHEPDVITGEPGAELKHLRWLYPGEIGAGDWQLDRFELWSQLALRLLIHYFNT
ncbi:MAG: hypothetical protein M1608_12280, partial [Candidatus Omnitrophica bacterium]|nr:hypothetical protein [Candidatus Omnitrophota bacterium]